MLSRSRAAALFHGQRGAFPVVLLERDLGQRIPKPQLHFDGPVLGQALDLLAIGALQVFPVFGIAQQLLDRLERLGVKRIVVEHLGKQLGGLGGVLHLIAVDGGHRVVQLGSPRRLAFQAGQFLQGLDCGRPLTLLVCSSRGS
jgi:hypothetical protein